MFMGQIIKTINEIENKFGNYLPHNAIEWALVFRENDFESYFPDNAIEPLKTEKEIGNEFETYRPPYPVDWTSSTKNKSEINLLENVIDDIKTEKEIECEYGIYLTDNGVPWCKTEKETEDKSEINNSSIRNSIFTREELAREKLVNAETRRRFQEMLEKEFKTKKETEIAYFFDPKKGTRYYLDRYYNEPVYKDWFDTNFPDYTIEEAIKLAIPSILSKSEPQLYVPDFYDPNKDLQQYIDIYNNDPMYKDWFDRKYPFQSIYEIVGIPEPQETENKSGINLPYKAKMTKYNTFNFIS